MSRSSPGVRRIAAILNFIADHPGQAFALTDLVRALRLSRATCHALLTGLVDVGYLYRTSDKTYVLGPALAALGRTAAEHFSPLQVAQPEMRALADAFDVLCGAYFLEGDVVHLRDRAASVSHVGYPVPLGNRHDLRVTQAPVFFTGAPDAAEAWFTRRYPMASADMRQAFARSMHFVVEHGFVIVVRRPEFAAGLPSAEEVIANDDWDLPVEALGEIDDTAAYPLAAIFAPVVDAQGRVSFVLGLVGFYAPVSGAAAMATGRRLRETCDRISAFIARPNADLSAPDDPAEDDDDGDDAGEGPVLTRVRVRRSACEN
jgi:DNA-binding IclR family transcriptional regulator